MEKIEVDTKETLESIIDRVEHGEEVIVVRNGRIVAKIVQEAGPSFDRQDAMAAMESIKERRKGVTLEPDPDAENDRREAQEAANRILERSKTASLGGLSIKDLINEGRR